MSVEAIMLRLKKVFTAVAVLLLLFGCIDRPVARAQTMVEPKGFLVGQSQAGVSLRLYYSFLNPRFRKMMVDVFPVIYDNYIKSGKINMVIFDYYIGRPDFLGGLMAHCVDKPDYLHAVTYILDHQSEWSLSSNPKPQLTELGRQLGLPQERLSHCLDNSDFAQSLLASYKMSAGSSDAVAKDSYYFFKNGKSLPFARQPAGVDELSPEGIRFQLDRALAK